MSDTSPAVTADELKNRAAKLRGMQDTMQSASNAKSIANAQANMQAKQAAVKKPGTGWGGYKRAKHVLKVSPTRQNLMKAAQQALANRKLGKNKIMQAKRKK